MIIDTDQQGVEYSRVSRSYVYVHQEGVCMSSVCMCVCVCMYVCMCVSVSMMSYQLPPPRTWRRAALDLSPTHHLQKYKASRLMVGLMVRWFD